MNNVKIIRSIKRTSISIRIGPDASVTVTAPYLYPASRINKLLEQKKDWIRQKQQEIILHNSVKLSTENEAWYLGKKYPLEFRRNRQNIVELEDKFYVASTNPRSIQAYLTAWYKQQARKIIQKRVDYYSRLAGLHYNIMSITDAQTRWGSCSSDRNLHFNWRLIMAPLPVIDYLVAHELSHLVEMNHSRDFWTTVRKMFPLYRQYNTWLKRYGHTLILPSA